MKRPVWVLRETVLALHEQLLAAFGGSSGIRDEGLLDSALARPENRHAYDAPAVFELAAAYAFGLVKNHPFVDGNKRIGFAAAIGFLEITANNPDMGEAKEELTVQYKGSTFSVGFNAAYFLDCLGVMEDEQVVLQLGDEVSPCLIQSEIDRGFTHVIMPMRV